MNICKISIILLSGSLLLFACKGTDKVSEVATEFLNNYLATNYTKAAELCTSEFSKSLLNATEDLNSLDDQMKEKIKEHSKKLTVSIGQIEKVGKGDTLMVNYSLVGEQLPIESSLCLVKVQKIWQVARLNK